MFSIRMPCPEKPCTSRWFWGLCPTYQSSTSSTSSTIRHKQVGGEFQHTGRMFDESIVASGWTSPFSIPCCSYPENKTSIDSIQTDEETDFSCVEADRTGADARGEQVVVLFSHDPLLCPLSFVDFRNSSPRLKTSTGEKQAKVKFQNFGWIFHRKYPQRPGKNT